MSTLMKTAASTTHAHAGDVHEVRIVAELEEPSIYDRLWQPYLAHAGGDQLALAFGAHLRGKYDMGDIRVSVSSDAGASWAPAVTVFDHRQLRDGRRFGYANPVMYRPPGSDTLWCFAMRAPLCMKSTDDGELAAAYSVDGGWSWLELPLSNLFNSRLITTCHPVAVERPEGRRYLLPVHRGTLLNDDHGDLRLFVLESSDLLSWRLAGYVPMPPGDRVFLHEGSLAATAPGELTMLMRTCDYQSRRQLEVPLAYRTTSRDGGRSWSTAVPEQGCHNTIAKCFFGVEPDGSWLYVYSPGQAWERRSLAWVRRRREGGAWSQPRTFYDGGNRNSYPTLIARPAGGWWATWDSSDGDERVRTRICFGRFDSVGTAEEG